MGPRRFAPCALRSLHSVPCGPCALCPADGPTQPKKNTHSTIRKFANLEACTICPDYPWGGGAAWVYTLDTVCPDYPWVYALDTICPDYPWVYTLDTICPHYPWEEEAANLKR